MPIARGIVRAVITRGTQKFNLGQAVETLTAWVETKPLDLNDPRTVKNLDMLLVNLYEAVDLTNLVVEIYSLEELDGTPVLQDTISLADGVDALPIRAEDAPYWIFRFEDTGVTSLWKLGGFEVGGDVVGERF